MYISRFRILYDPNKIILIYIKFKESKKNVKEQQYVGRFSKHQHQTDQIG